MSKYTTKLKDKRPYNLNLDNLEVAINDVQKYVSYIAEDIHGVPINERASQLVEEMKDILIELRDQTIWEPNIKIEED